MSDVVYEVQKVFGVLKEFPNGWRKLACLVSWNNADPKVDIRDWNPDMTRMTRGITLTMDEFEVLKNIEV